MLPLPRVGSGILAACLTHHAADLAGQGEGGEVSFVDALRVQVSDVELDASVVLGSDQLVGPSAAGAGRKTTSPSFEQKSRSEAAATAVLLLLLLRV